MSDSTAATLNDPVAIPPMASLPRLCGGAAIAALASGVLGSTATGIAWANGADFEPGRVLAIAAVVPKVLVLFVFARAMRTLRFEGADSLRRAGICYLATVGVLTIVAEIGDPGATPTPAPVILATIVGGIVSAVLFTYVVGKDWWHVPLLLYFLVRYAGGWLTTGKRLGALDALFALAVILMAASFVGYSIWFGLRLIRSRRDLGSTATGLGATIIGTLALAVLAVPFVIAVVATTPGATEMTDAQLDVVFESAARPMYAVAAVAELAVAGCTAALFLALRHRVRLDFQRG